MKSKSVAPELGKPTSISFTPTFFIAGYQLPELYKVEDLQYFIAEMVEEIAVSC
jgi:protein-disulfide isomerase